MLIGDQALLRFLARLRFCWKRRCQRIGQILRNPESSPATRQRWLFHPQLRKWFATFWFLNEIKLKLIEEINKTLQLGLTVSQRNQLGCSPHEPIHDDGSNELLHLLHVGFITPRLHIQQNRRLSDESGFLRLLLSVSLHAVFLNLRSFLGLVFRPEQIDIIVVISCWSWCRC